MKKAKALREDIAEKATLSRIAGAREAEKRRAEREGRTLAVGFETAVGKQKAAFDTRHIAESYYLNGGRLGNDINGEEWARKSRLLGNWRVSRISTGQLNLTHLFNEYQT